ncbi:MULTISPECIES: ABC-three component system protein [unclassified Microcoleus]|uniref:ABC-three component system protein n=1 Tax=unclassified Microcoleus TaxID=2642155 RepID=UPI002FD751FD
MNQHIEKNLELQKKLEDDLLHANDSKEEAKLERQIEALIRKRSTHQKELNTISLQKREAIAREMPYVSFDELDIVTKFILGMQPASPEINFNITDVTQKISKNNLTQEVHFLLIMGMVKVKEVHRFIEVNAALRPDFPEKLKAGFVTEYQRLLKADIRGDALFESLHKFSCGNSSDLKKTAAGLAVLSYLFERCEVFER